MKKIYIFTIGVLLSVCLGSTQNFYAAAAASTTKENPFTKRKRELGEQLINIARNALPRDKRQHENLQKAKKLINLKASLDFVNKKGGPTALMWAALNGNASLVKVLLDAGANVNQQSGEQGTTTALMGAAFASLRDVDSYDTIEMLLNAGAEVNLKNADGLTALSWAILRGNRTAVYLLVLAGADLSIRDNKGDTAWTLPVNSQGVTREAMNAVIEEALAERKRRAEHISSTSEREHNIPSPVGDIIAEYEGSKTPRAVPTEAGEGEVEEKEGADIQKQKNLEDID